MNHPMGRVVRLDYRDENPNVAEDMSAFVVHFRAPDGDYYEHPLENGPWMVHNSTLQLMALNGFRPTDLDGTTTNTEAWQWMVPIAPNSEGGYLLGMSALSGGVRALKDAEWFSASDDTDATDDDHSGPHGGGSPDPSTGNRGGIDNEEDGGVRAELTPDENTGVNFTIE